jgi:hypothetical protein
METKTLAAGIVGFLLGGLVVSVAAEIEREESPPPAHGAVVQRVLER